MGTAPFAEPHLAVVDAAGARNVGVIDDVVWHEVRALVDEASGVVPLTLDGVHLTTLSGRATPRIGSAISSLDGLLIAPMS